MADPLSIPPEVMQLLFGMPRPGITRAQATQEVLARGPSPFTAEYPNVPVMRPEPGEDPRPYAESWKKDVSGVLAKQKANEPDLSTPSGALSLAMGVVGGPRLRLPPAIGAYHGTSSPIHYEKFNLPPKTHDIGIHSTIDPSVSNWYARPFDPSINVNKAKFLQPGAEPVGNRTIPVVLDVKSALKFPADVGKWNIPSNVTSALESSMSSGFKAPRGLLEELHNISGSEAGWQQDFVPLLKSLGYDSIYYPHGSEFSRTGKYNTFLAFDPEQTIPRFTREGQRLIAQRGIHEPMKFSEFDPNAAAPNWRLPQGVLKNPTEFETLRKLPSENTTQWWAENAPPSVLKNISKDIEAKQAYWAKQVEAHKEVEALSKAADKQKWADFIEQNPGFKFPKGLKYNSPGNEFSLNFANKYVQPASEGQLSWKQVWDYMDAVKHNEGHSWPPGFAAGYIETSKSPAHAKAAFDNYIQFKNDSITKEEFWANNKEIAKKYKSTD